RSQQVGRLVLSPEIARLRDLRVEEVQRLSHVLWTRVPGVTHVAAVLREEGTTLERDARQGRPVGRRRRVERVDREPDDDRDDDEERDHPSDPGHQRRDQHPLPRMPDPAARQGRRPIGGTVAAGRAAHDATGGGAIASATTSVSRRRRSAVFVKIVIPTLTTWMIPEPTIIAPKIPRAM